ncbi:DUF6516 family protein [Xanthomonas campestris pv. campestris]|uniref:toxin-antitoxin system TumE family protein n=1 Tax=Xanthomonas campestris TaxID=339 RepID=UPI002367A88C|nr:DUF6516 family protein [Xanthomonas campestris]MEB1416093.1 DUF6516 family protein [Xanthomonas campestris pv. campestris]MEB1461838.1 DUF6516 family protein [Xanthomonas campestris pv. campestris]MEB1502890.1 DUF6516 family protein [Xanthomonas campestris pv. campestris]MEB1527477.1 DUF6516 family protein [Xanthomonas campestris pv. campestris]MEB1587995.1 DUF6516 family protein [Xanthomonas campestris pv. campestris]
MSSKSQVLTDRRVKLGEDAFAEIRIVLVPKPVRGSAHNYKYGLAYVVAGTCVLRYDNEAGKGDHKGTSEQRTTDTRHYPPDVEG